MIRVSVQIETRGVSPLKRFDYFETFTVPFVQQEIIAVAEVVRDSMRSIIANRKIHKNKGQSKLEKAIDVDIVGQGSHVLVVGVGRIIGLPPYWKALNDGFTPPTIGNFVANGSFSDGAPSSDRSGGVWNVGQGVSSFFDKKLHKTVAPFNYIDLAEAEGYKVLQDVQKRIQNLIKTGSV